MAKTKSAIYSINYHIVWCTKYRKPILTGKIESFLKDQLETIAATKGWTIKGLQIMPDHIHMFISCPPIDSPTAIVKILKGVTGLQLFRKYPRLKNRLWKGHVWTPSYYVGTAGEVSAETIRKYIENQKSDSSPLQVGGSSRSVL